MNTKEIYDALKGKEREARQNYIDAKEDGRSEDAKRYNFEAECFDLASLNVEKVLLIGKETIDNLRKDLRSNK